LTIDDGLSIVTIKKNYWTKKMVWKSIVGHRSYINPELI